MAMMSRGWEEESRFNLFWSHWFMGEMSLGAYTCWSGYVTF